MPIQIHWPDGTVTTPKGTTMNEAGKTNALEISDRVQPGAMQYATAGLAHGYSQERTIATVAAELQYAMDYSSRVPKLRAELDGLLGRKPRGAKKGTP